MTDNTEQGRDRATWDGDVSMPHKRHKGTCYPHTHVPHKSMRRPDYNTWIIPVVPSRFHHAVVFFLSPSSCFSYRTGWHHVIPSYHTQYLFWGHRVAAKNAEHFRTVRCSCRVLRYRPVDPIELATRKRPPKSHPQEEASARVLSRRSADRHLGNPSNWLGQ